MKSPASIVVLCSVVLAFSSACAQRETARTGPGDQSLLAGQSVTLAPQQLELDCGGGVKMQLVLIPAGEFLMGSPETEAGRQENEGPRHLVRITRPFLMGKCEITQGQWKAVMGTNPVRSRGIGEDVSVNEVSWDYCQEFCRKLSTLNHRTVRLPTEAEWEYACRAGTTTAFCFGDDPSPLNEYAVTGPNQDLVKERRVGQKKPNAWGLYDMHGNVSEWCADRYGTYEPGAQTDPRGPSTGDSHVVRGGSWCTTGEWWRYRSAQRQGEPSDSTWGDVGARVVVELGDSKVSG
jgi:formylglycine-generating enzyme required for sulfatase activity